MSGKMSIKDNVYKTTVSSVFVDKLTSVSLQYLTDSVLVLLLLKMGVFISFIFLIFPFQRENT